MLWRYTRFISALACIGMASSTSLPGHAAGNPPTSLPVVMETLAPPPRDCATTNMVHEIHGGPPLGGGWIGNGTVVGYSAWQVRDGHAILTFGARTRYGYPQKVFWQLTHRVKVKVTLDGWNLRTRQRIWFGHPLPAAHTRPLVAPPIIAWPSAMLFDHRAPTLTFVPAAGCYVLRARWETGEWMVPFAAGCGTIQPGACVRRRA
jgi:hypothetical protein